MDDLYLDGLVSKYGSRVFSRRQVKEDADNIYIGRPSCYGNPIYLSDINDVDLRIVKVLEYREHLFQRLSSDSAFVEEIRKLKGKNVICYCSNGTTSVEEGARYCHGHVLLSAVDYFTQ